MIRVLTKAANYLFVGKPEVAAGNRSRRITPCLSQRLWGAHKTTGAQFFGIS